MATPAFRLTASLLDITRRRTIRSSVCALIAGGTLMLGSIGRAQQAPGDVGYRDFAYGTTPTPSPSGEKAENKLWWNDGIWWGSLWSPAAGRYDIHRLDLSSHTWIDTGVALDDRPNSKADTLWDAASGKLYVASSYYSSTPAASTSSSRWGRLYRYSYSAAQDQYTLDSGFPVVVTNGSAEVMTLAKDGNGRLWVTWVENKVVKFNYSLSNDLQWYTPSTLPVGSIGTTASDDISAIIAFGSSIGIMWSNQASGIMYFTVHRDNDPFTVWQAAELVLPNCTGPCADDHISLKADSTGRVFAATKTSFTTVGSPLIFLSVRATDGTWTNYVVGTHADHHTRPIVLLAEGGNKIFVFASQPETGGSIYYKVSPLDNISFQPGLGTLFIQSSADLTVNNATSTRDNVNATTGIVVLATDADTRRYLHNELMASPSAPLTVTSFSPASGGAGTAVTITGTGFTATTQVQFNQTATAFTVLSDQQIQTTVPAGATTGPISVTAANGTASSATSFTVTVGPGQGSTIKDITFEGGSLTDAANGVDRVNGSVQLESGSPIDGAYSARISGASDAYLEENFTAADDLAVTLYFRIDALPAKDVRILQISNSGTTVGNIVLQANGTLRLRVGGTNVGVASAALTVGQLYGLQVRQKRGAGTDALLEAFLSTGSQTFGAPFASLGSGTWTTAANRVRLGGTNGVALWVTLDDIRLTAGGQ